MYWAPHQVRDDVIGCAPFLPCPLHAALSPSFRRSLRVVPSLLACHRDVPCPLSLPPTVILPTVIPSFLPCHPGLDPGSIRRTSGVYWIPHRVRDDGLGVRYSCHVLRPSLLACHSVVPCLSIAMFRVRYPDLRLSSYRSLRPLRPSSPLSVCPCLTPSVLSAYTYKSNEFFTLNS